MKKLLFFGYTLEMGGAEKVLIDYLKVLKDKYEIDLVLFNKKGELVSEIPENVDVCELRKNDFQYALFRYVPFFRRRKINSIANQKEYDVAIGFFEGRSATWVADIKKNIKRIAWIHNDVCKFDIGIPEKEILDSYNKMDMVVTVSEKAKENFCKKYNISNEKVEVLYNLIDEKSILDKSKVQVEKNDGFTFVNVGKMRPQKRQDRLIHIAKKLKDDGYDFKIQIIGNGPEEDKIKSLIDELDVSDKIELLGLKTNPYPYIKNADCFVLSSEFEGFGIAVKEALILGQLVISTKVTGVEEMLEAPKYGLITGNSTEALYQEMKKVLSGEIDVEAIKNNLKDYDSGNNQVIDKLIHIIEG